MTLTEIADAFLSKVNLLDILGAAPYCTDEFTYSGPLPEPLGLHAWAETAAPFLKGIPDWNFNAKVIGEEANVVHVTAHVTGTHTGELDLSALGLGVIPATGKSIALPESKGRLTFDGDRIVNFHIDPAHGAGVPGILAQIGASMPPG